MKLQCIKFGTSKFMSEHYNIVSKFVLLGIPTYLGFGLKQIFADDPPSISSTFYAPKILAPKNNKAKFNWRNLLSYEKRMCKMLMKLTPSLSKKLTLFKSVQ